MKKSQIVLFILMYVTAISYGQKTSCNVKDGIAISGYDVVSYFDGKAKKGKRTYTVTYKEINYFFSSNENMKKFETNPETFLPQYGGWCAYAMGSKGEKVDMNPKEFEIRDGKLFLFYNAYFTNTYKKWLDEGPEKLQKTADTNWKKMK